MLWKAVLPIFQSSSLLIISFLVKKCIYFYLHFRYILKCIFYIHFKFTMFSINLSILYLETNFLSKCKQCLSNVGVNKVQLF